LPPLDRLPWDIAQDEFKPAGAAFLAVLGQVVVTAAKDQIGRQVGATLEKSGRHPPSTAKDEISP
jgi:hypothetical protein